MTNTRRTVLGAGTATIAGVALAASAFAAPAAAVVSTPNFIEPTAGATQINLLGINDFHGRILTAEQYAATLFTAEADFGGTNTLMFSNGDHVGASLFQSSIQNDQPTIDILNVIGLDAYTQGNHEFDKGADDAINRIAPETIGADLAANVIAPDGTKPFDEYAIFTVNGVQVAIIGAVTQETPGLVSPAGVAGYDFTDPVDAVNEVAQRLSDGDASNGEADIIVASYHEGAPLSNAPIEENLASAVFDKIVNQTDASVDAIFNAHSHRTYAYDAPVPGVDGATRPVVQAGEYAGNIAQVVLTLDAENNVTLAESSIVPTLAEAAIPADIASDPRLAQIRDIVADAVAQADILGSVEIGLIEGDITRAKQFDESGAVTVADDRANASALGDMVATSMVDSIASTGRDVDFAVMNPGGLRADMIDEDGIVTYKDAADVLPFANNLSVATLTGADVKALLEQQWQRTAAGEVPSRPFLQLGLSDGLTYTFDSERAEGDRITGIHLWGTPIDPAATYQVAAPTFLTAGGDNFHAFNNASSIADTGLIDLDAFVAWIEAKTEVEGALRADTARNNFEVKGFPLDAPLACGTATTFTVQNFQLGSVDAVPAGALVATAYVVDLASGEESSVEVGRAAVAEGENSVDLEITIPADFATDTFDIVVQAEGNGGYVVLPLAVECDGSSTAPTTPPATGTPIPGGEGEGELSTTGADSNILFGGIAAALAALVLGGAFLVLRRRSAESVE